MCICIYIYMYIHVYIYIYIYMICICIIQHNPVCLSYSNIYYILLYYIVIVWGAERGHLPRDEGPPLPRAQLRDARTKGAPRNGVCEQQLVWSCFTLNSLHAQALMLTYVQITFLGTPLVPSRNRTHVCIYIYIYIYICMYVYMSYIYIYIYIYICVYIYTYIYKHKCISIYLCFFSLSLYIYICICTYIYIYTHGQDARPVALPHAALDCPSLLHPGNRTDP